MEQMCYLAGLKQGAWLSKTGQYITDIKQALQLPYPEAIERCKTHKSASNILIPVPVEWMNSI